MLWSQRAWGRLLVVLSGWVFLVSLLGTLGADRADAATDVVCGVSVDDPHFTPRAGGVIAKVRVSCRGVSDVDAVQVRIVGSLGTINGGPGGPAPLGPPVPQVFTDQTQTVPLGGAQVSFYLPPVGQSPPHASAWYQAHAAGRIIDPPDAAGPSTTWSSHNSRTVYVSTGQES